MKIVSWALLATFSTATVGPAQEPPKPWWNTDVAAALAKAKENRGELELALANVPVGRRAGMAFLIENMPDRDSVSLKAAYLLENVALAYEARELYPWGKTIPEERFLNDVLPYASVNESRDDWRKGLSDICRPIVRDCKTASEAAQALNAKLFSAVKVKYSTQRNRADQGPKQTMETGLASCTGLSVLLVDACRSVGVPARVAGIPNWANKRGNHTWVEIWDGDWHFTGACEADPKGLDRAWFVGDAALAKKDERLHAIYASSFKRTKTTFPLVWAPDVDDVFAENVTERYAAGNNARKDRSRVMVVVRGQDGKRVSLPVVVVDSKEPDKVLGGRSKDESADTNDFLTFDVARNRTLTVRVGGENGAEKKIETGDKAQVVVEFVWKEAKK